ncbi:ATP-grasp domain-containing protein [Vagococcus sp. WN89Y]|uniref:ATP-grasp domain-containing protein n=1 Tax=Vagococcus sp. WN89Y TaxID=3457258 RepID=UPI003FCE6259
MNILVTAIGSMSAEVVIKQLQYAGHRVYGCDIHPARWLFTSRLVDGFAQIPRAVDQQAWIEAIVSQCEQHHIAWVIPLTDVEVDLLSLYRDRLPTGTQAAIMPAGAAVLCRDKYAWAAKLGKNPAIKTLAGCTLSDWRADGAVFPAILKPCRGRSSEGLRHIHCAQELEEARTRLNGDEWIVQPKVAGDIFTVDVVYQASGDLCAAVARKELIRTSNGAGISVEMIPDTLLLDTARLIARETGANGCFNMEFIGNQDGYFLMDINPRFSAGVEFSVKAGYDMVNNHLACFSTQAIDAQQVYQTAFYTRHYVAE